MLDDARLLAFLQDLVRVNSTPGRNEAIVQRVVGEMALLGFDDARVDAAGNAVGTIGSGRPIVMIDCHVDTIPLHQQERWTHPPFAAEVDGDRIYGLGAADMKASAAAAVYGAARLTSRQGRGDVRPRRVTYSS